MLDLLDSPDIVHVTGTGELFRVGDVIVNKDPYQGKQYYVIVSYSWLGFGWYHMHNQHLGNMSGSSKEVDAQYHLVDPLLQRPIKVLEGFRS